MSKGYVELTWKHDGRKYGHGFEIDDNNCNRDSLQQSVCNLGGLLINTIWPQRQLTELPSDTELIKAKVRAVLDEEMLEKANVELAALDG